MKRPGRVFALLSVLAALLCSASCGSLSSIYPETPDEETAGGYETRVFSDYRQIYQIHLVDTTRTRTPRGFVERRHKLEEEGIYHVYANRDLDQAVGFYMPNGKTFRYKFGGGGSIESVPIGRLEPEVAIRFLLDFAGEVELVAKPSPWN